MAVVADDQLVTSAVVDVDGCTGLLAIEVANGFGDFAAAVDFLLGDVTYQLGLFTTDG